MSTVLLEKPCPLISSLLPIELREKFDELSEKEMCAIAILITNIALGAIKALEKGHYKKFDANPGDGGCQMRALELRRLIKRDLKEELLSIKKEVSEIQRLVIKRQPNPKEKKDSLQTFFRSNFDQDFFQDNFKKLRVSKEIEYILHCYLSTVLRTRCATLENGVVMTRSEMSKLSCLSKKIDQLSSEFRNKIVEENQKQLSILSLGAIRASAERTTSLKGKEKELMITMLSEKHTHEFTPDKKYEPKLFGCLFYEVKTVLTALREEQGVVCLKSIMKAKKEEPFYIFLQSKDPEKEFEVLKEYTSLDPATLIVVFEAVMHVEKEIASKHLREYGFTKMVLMQAAQQAPYEPGSSLDDIKEPKALTEVTDYRKQGDEMENFFTLDHVYLNSLKEELG